jgi:Ca-activated chloride channel homolog
MLKKTALFAVLAATALAGCAPKVDTAEIAAPLKLTPAAVRPAVVQPGPEIKAADLVGMDAVTSNRFVAAEKPGEIVVRLHLSAKARKDARRPPINLALVVDTSGSMEGAAIDDARAASLALLDALSEGDRLSLVVFHSATEVLVPSTKLTKETIAAVRAKIAGMKASGTTDLAGGLAAGLAEVRKNLQADGINRVVLLGDGIPNDPSTLTSLSYTAQQQRISITALGLGLDHDETLMSQMALTSGGKYHFIHDSAKVAKVFTDEVLRLKDVTGRAAVVALRPGPGVAVKEVIGLPMQRVGTGAQVVLGDMSEGDERDLLVRLSVPARHTGSVVELLDADVSVDHPGSPGMRLSERAFVSARATSDAAEIAAGRDRGVALAVARLSVADAVVRAVAAARGGDVSLGKAILDQAEKEAKAAAKEFDDAELAEKVKSIAPLRKSLASLAPPPPPRGPTFVPGGPPPPVPGNLPAISVAPAAVAPRPAPAIVMKSQADAMSVLQGD